MANTSTPETKDDEKAKGAPAKVGEKGGEMPPEGPHARDDLIDESKTPGTGALTERRTDGEADAATG